MIRALLVDDEEPARLRLRTMLARHPDVEVVGEASDGAEALERAARSRPDVIFLDIQMPALNGMQVASALKPPRPRLVFCTAFDQYAVDAFEHHALDYLLKPLSRTKLDRALDRLRHSLNAQLDHDLREAALAQTRLLPQALPAMHRLDYAGSCRSARGVGGDFYDFLALGSDRLALLLGDVSGKGMGAGILMASLLARVQSLAPRWGDRLESLFDELNRELHASTEDNRFATLFYAVYDERNGSLSYVNAGHHPPLLRSAAAPERFGRLEGSGPPIGALPGARFERRTLQLREGDVLVIYSDGVTEALDPAGAELGTSGIERAVNAGNGLSAAELHSRVVAEVDRHLAGGQQIDDVTVVVARYGGSRDASAAG